MSGSKAIRDARRKRAALLVCSLAALVLAAPASADDPPSPGDVSAADAYRESVPTASGSKPTGGKGRPATLRPAVDERLRSLPQGEAGMLREAATSPALGAPNRSLRNDGLVAAELDERSIPSPSATADAVGGNVGSVRLVLLALALAAISVVAFAVRRADAPPTVE